MQPSATLAEGEERRGHLFTGGGGAVCDEDGSSYGSALVIHTDGSLSEKSDLPIPEERTRGAETHTPAVGSDRGGAAGAVPTADSELRAGPPNIRADWNAKPSADNDSGGCAGDSTAEAPGTATRATATGMAQAAGVGDRINAYLDETLAIRRPNKAGGATTAAHEAQQKRKGGAAPRGQSSRGQRQRNHASDSFIRDDDRGFFAEAGGAAGGVVQVLAGMERLHSEVVAIKHQIDTLSLRVRQQRARALLHHQLPHPASHQGGGKGESHSTEEASSTSRSTTVFGQPQSQRHSALSDRPAHNGVARDEGGEGHNKSPSSSSLPGGVGAASLLIEDDESRTSRMGGGGRASGLQAPLAAPRQGRTAHTNPSVLFAGERKSTTDSVGQQQGSPPNGTNSTAEGWISPHSTPSNGVSLAVPPQRTNGHPHRSLNAPPSPPSPCSSFDGDLLGPAPEKGGTSDKAIDSVVPPSDSSRRTTTTSASRQHRPRNAHDVASAAVREDDRESSSLLSTSRPPLPSSPLTPLELQQLSEDVAQLERLYSQRGCLLMEVDAFLRSHAEHGERWEADEERVACYRCQRVFSGMTTRHHCRRCGRLCCGQCSQFFGTKQDTSVRDHAAGIDAGSDADPHTSAPPRCATTWNGDPAFRLTAPPTPHGGGADHSRHRRVTVKTEYVARMTADDARDEAESRFDTFTHPISLSPPLPPSSSSQSTMNTTTTVPGAEQRNRDADAAGASCFRSCYDETDINDPDTILREEESARRSRDSGGSLGTSPFLSFTATAQQPHQGGGGQAAPAFSLPPPEAIGGSASYAQLQQQQQQQKLQHSEVRLCSVCYHSCLRARKSDLMQRLRSANRYILDDGYYYYHVLSAEEMANFGIVMKKPGTVRKRAELLSSVALEKTADVAAATPHYMRQTMASAAHRAPQVLRTIGQVGAYTVQRTKTAAMVYLANYANGGYLRQSPSEATATVTNPALEDNGSDDTAGGAEGDIVSVKSDGSSSANTHTAAGTARAGEHTSPRDEAGEESRSPTKRGEREEIAGMVESGPIRERTAHVPATAISASTAGRSTSALQQEKTSNGTSEAQRLPSAPPDDDDDDDDMGNNDDVCRDAVKGEEGESNRTNGDRSNGEVGEADRANGHRSDDFEINLPEER